MTAFTTFVRPLLEYASCVWSPYNITLITKLESVQRSFTKKLTGLRQLTYTARLKYLKIDSLEIRRLKADLLMYYKILWGWVDLDVSTFFSMSNSQITRGHSFKLNKPLCKNSHQLGWFNHRAVTAWNALPENIVTSSSPAAFKRMLRSANLSNYCTFY